MAQTTSKKVKYVGTEHFINAETGELQEMQVTSIEDRDFNFSKVWMRNFIATLDIVGNQKTKLCFWIIDNVDKNNVLIGTYRTIADKSGISLDTVRITMKILLDADFMRKEQNGVYIINPDIVFKGKHNARMNILNQYNTVERITMSDEEKLSNLVESIRELTKRAEALQAKIDRDRDSVPENENASAPSECPASA